MLGDLRDAFEKYVACQKELLREACPFAARMEPIFAYAVESGRIPSEWIRRNAERCTAKHLTALEDLRNASRKCVAWLIRDVGPFAARIEPIFAYPAEAGSMSADQVPGYFARFSEEDVFRGNRFDLFQLSRSAETAWKVDFVIATRGQGEG